MESLTDFVWIGRRMDFAQENNQKVMNRELDLFIGLRFFLPEF